MQLLEERPDTGKFCILGDPKGETKFRQAGARDARGHLTRMPRLMLSEPRFVTRDIQDESVAGRVR